MEWQQGTLWLSDTFSFIAGDPPCAGITAYYHSLHLPEHCE
jgi:hypothetical protein